MRHQTVWPWCHGRRLRPRTTFYLAASRLQSLLLRFQDGSPCRWSTLFFGPGRPGESTLRTLESCSTATTVATTTTINESEHIHSRLVNKPDSRLDSLPYAINVIIGRHRVRATENSSSAVKNSSRCVSYLRRIPIVDSRLPSVLV